MTPATVLVPTFRRPESLERALRSLAAQVELGRWAAAVVVVDNAPEASARGVVDRLRPLLPIPLRFVHAPTPGVATARNAGLAIVDTAHVAFLDDDETASPTWLRTLMEAHLGLGADVTFGPVRGRAPDARPLERDEVERFFSRLKDGPDRLLPDSNGCGCGNSAMRRATALVGPAPFDTGADHAGGEDDRLFERLAAAGARFGWAADAWVDEEAPASRANARYLLARAFVRGQGPPRRQLRRTPANRVGAAGWMLVGAVQLALYAPAAVALRLLRRPAWLGLALRAAGGLGKMSPWKEMNFYGAAMLSADPPRRARPSPTASAAVMTQVKSL